MGLRAALDRIQEDEPGQRFVRAHERHKIDNYIVRMFVVGLGVAFMFAAAVTFWLPGPNFVLVFAGLAIVGAQSKLVAGWMDRGEVAGRRWNDEVWDPYPHKTAVKVGVVVLVAAGGAGFLWLAYEQGWLPNWLAKRLP